MPAMMKKYQWKSYGNTVAMKSLDLLIYLFIYQSISINLCIPGPRYKTTHKKEEKNIVYNYENQIYEK